ncbi:MAG: hypothetical protein DMG14_24735 [Acidobacteria bacterium]|nr:MAG: hypothetical protein DMG14_24735 [Acidobacteriota bacterium]
MSKVSNNPISFVTTGGIAGSHPSLPNDLLKVAPASATESNRFRSKLIPLACWRLEDIRFEFDSSFVKPEVNAEIQHLFTLRQAHQKIDDVTQKTLFPPMSVFGHADPVSNDDYNKKLSGRRALAVYGLITRNTAIWEDLFSQPLGGDNWGEKSLATMRITTGLPKDTPRPALFKAYMDQICTIRDDKGQAAKDSDGKQIELRLNPKEDFLARGEDSHLKGDVQGCGEFNPVMIFSEKEAKAFEPPARHAERNLANAPNRRVVIFLFRVGTRVDPKLWPCPHAKDGVAGCRERFWSDGEKRRSKRLPDERREYQDTRDTFACRFYDRLANRSPCESVREGNQWLAEVIAKDLQAVVLGVFQPDGTELRRIPFSDSTPGPGDSRSFDLTGFPSGTPVTLILFEGKTPISAPTRLIVGSLRPPQRDPGLVQSAIDSALPAGGNEPANEDFTVGNDVIFEETINNGTR